MVERSKSLLLMLAATAALTTTACQKDDSSSGGADAGVGGGEAQGGTPGTGGDPGTGGNPSGGTPTNGGEEPPVGGGNDGGTPVAGGAGGEGGSGPVGGEGGSGGGGTLPIGSACDPADDQCVSGALCGDLGFGKGPVCFATCDTVAEPTGCAADEHCGAIEECAQDAETCAGICIPSEGCSPCNAAETCGGPASCFVGSLAPASLCLTAGTVDVGGDCLTGDTDPTLPESNCMEGLTCFNGVCRAPCGGAMCGAGDTTCGEGEICADFSAKLNGTDFNFCTPSCSTSQQTGCAEGELCFPGDDATINGNLAMINVCGEGTDGEKIDREACTEDPMTYFGDCTAGHLCADVLGDRPTICNGFCDLNDTSACLGAAACLFGLFQAEGLGLCIGECDPFADPTTCGDGKKCESFPFYGMVGGHEKIIGRCEDALPDPVAATGEDCVQDDMTGVSNCAVGNVCVQTGAANEPPICLPLCSVAAESPYTCPAGFTCQTGTFAGRLNSDRDSAETGICLPM